MRYGKLQNVRRDADRSPRRALGSPRGVTLIEMLIVLFIISLLAVVALRALPNEDQRPREAARMLNVYISTAKNNAAATGRPAGIVLRPWRDIQKYTPPALPPTTYINYSTVVEQCEVPEDYAGEMLSTQLLVQDWTFVPNTAAAGTVPYCMDGRAVIKLLIPVNEFGENLIRYGDQIQLNGQGPVFTICWDGPDGLYSARPPASVSGGTANGTGTMIVSKTANGIPPPEAPWPLLSAADSGKNWPEEYNFPNTNDSYGNHDPNGYISCLMDPQPPARATYRPNSPDNIWIDNYCVTCYLDPRQQLPLPWPTAMTSSFYSPKPPVSFNIIRQPVKSAGRPLQLPPGSGVDLTTSGVDRGFFFDRALTAVPPPIVLLFSPSGSLESLYVGSQVVKPTQPIHLLLGKLTVNSEPDNNWCDMRNVIVTVNPQTGAVSTSPVYPPYFSRPPASPPFPNDPPAAIANQFNPDNPPQYDPTKPLTDPGTVTVPGNAAFIQALFYSRKFAREAQLMGGKR
jgi:prepilin-type N-terminal cleavage/methylation domain-containing protein